MVYALWIPWYGGPVVEAKTIGCVEYDRDISAALFSAPGVPAVPGYEVVEELGRGGMGVVYLALQANLNRLVALKMVVDAFRFHESDRLRFLAEAEAIAAIQHPNVVQVYECGQTRGFPYLAMEFIDGGSLAQALIQHGPMSPHSAAALIAQVARGVQAAHDVGVVHRDLKPANILLQGSLAKAGSQSAQPLPIPKVTDFGIAKRGTGKDLTLTGMVMGTPAYMAPEMAAGKAKFVGPAADIYALGVILFECLAGRTPFVAENSQSLLFRVVEDEAPLVRSVLPTVPRDLELICDKCLAKDPHQRYPSAAALAADLDRFAAGEPVSVRPPGRLEKALRWTRRHPARAALYGLAALASSLTGLSAGALTLLHRAEQARAQADQARLRAEEAQAATQQALEGEAAARLALAVADAARDTDFAYREYEVSNIDYARSLLGLTPPRLRTWEWNYVARMAQREAWTASPGAGKLVGVGFAEGGDLVAGGAGGLWKWDVHTRQPARLLSESIACMAVSGDGKRAAVGTSGTSPRTFVVELPAGKVEREIAWPAQALALDYRGERLLQVGKDGMRIRNLVTDEEHAAPLRGHTANQQPAIDPFGQHLAIAQLSFDHERPAGCVQIFGADGRERPDRFLVGGKPATACAFCANRPILAAGGGDGAVMAFDLEQGSELLRPAFVPGKVITVALSMDGRWLAAGGEDRVIRVWRLDEYGSTLAFTFKGHSGPVTGLAFEPAGTQLASVSVDGSVRLWDITGVPDAVRLQVRGCLTAAAVLPSGKEVLATDTERLFASYDLASGEPISSLQRTSQVGLAIRLNPGRTEASVYGGGKAFDLFPLKPSGGVQKPGDDLPVAALAASGDGKRFIRRGADGRVTVSDAAGATICVTGPHAGESHWTAISPDGKRVVTGGSDRIARVWDADTGKELTTLIGHNAEVTAAAVSPDRVRIATASRDGVMKIWDSATGRVRLSLPSQNHEVSTLAWTPDGHKLIAGNRDGVVQVFDGGPHGK
jgi:serine/threonine protein kinase/WD40 repeat protein